MKGESVYNQAQKEWEEEDEDDLFLDDYDEPEDDFEFTDGPY